jgi:hypothetical protein
MQDSLVPITKSKDGLRALVFEAALNEFYDSYVSDGVLSKPILQAQGIRPEFDQPRPILASDLQKRLGEGQISRRGAT